VLANAIATLGTVLDAREPRLTAKLPALHEREWSERAADRRAGALDLLLATICGSGKSRVTQQRFELLMSWGNDPRLAMRFAEILERPPYRTRNAAPFWTFVFGALPSLGDPRLLERVRRLPDAWADLDGDRRRQMLKFLGEVLPQLEVTYANGVSSLTPDEEALCRETVAAALNSSGAALEKQTVHRRTESQLLADVFQRPSEDGPRLVLADYLQERGDPRGEFITLQFLGRSRRLTRDEQRRERSLIAKHWARWLGPIASKVRKNSLRFERGFPSQAMAIEIDESWEWSTFEQLAGPLPQSGTLRLKALRRLESDVSPLIDQLESLEELRISGPAMPADWHWSSERNVEIVETFTRLRRPLRALAIRNAGSWEHPQLSPDAFDWLWKGPPMRELEIHAHPSQLEAWRRAAEAHRLARLSLRLDPFISWLPNGGSFQLILEGEGLSRLHLMGTKEGVPYRAGALALAIEGILKLAPHTLTSLTYSDWTPPKATQALLESATSLRLTPATRE
jgi:uncharacterized protein (TIGR02996 family)